jgi:lipoprotein-anchoring transpeptidase ErfK/SrfK
MERNFKTTLDGTITVKKGTYNQVMNNAEEIKYLIEKLEKREVCENREPIWKVKPVASGEEKTYIEIDLSAQHVWYYENGVLVIEADCVTGTDNTKRETPTGVYYISQMIEGTYLTGPTWRSWVDKWMRITSDGVGLHDAQWRDSDEFGGNTYKTDGSHGCINLPKSFAYELYDKVKYGTMVIVHD